MIIISFDLVYLAGVLARLVVEISGKGGGCVFFGLAPFDLLLSLYIVSSPIPMSFGTWNGLQKSDKTCEYLLIGMIWIKQLCLGPIEVYL